MNNSPFILIVFGATGDLMKNKLSIALYNLFKSGFLSQDFYIIGFSRRDFNNTEFRNFIYESISKKEKINPVDWDLFSKHLFYQNGYFSEEKGYKELIQQLSEIDKKYNACIARIFYLATPPQNYDSIIDLLSETKLSEGCGQDSNKWTRIAIEKPFGKDLKSAKLLDEKLGKIFEEKQIFRVDHYLAKETVRNILIFRFANSIFEPIWNSKYIDNIQITLFEKKGIEQRGQFFEGVGILRDLMQSHIMQLIASVAMEQPKDFSQESVRDARSKAISALRCIEKKDLETSVVRARYASYLSEKDVQKDSQTETFSALKLFIDNDRFKNMPFYIRCGKKMSEDLVEISVVFKQTCHILFKEIGCPEFGNILKIRIQPDEGISMRVIIKKPIDTLNLESIDLKFNYKEKFKDNIDDAYIKILLDVFKGEQILFNRSDELASSWDFITKILEFWTEQKLHDYEDNSNGPRSAIELIEKDGRKWV